MLARRSHPQSLDAFIDAVASRQHGLISAAQLRGQGATPSEVRSRVDRELLVTVRRGVYRCAGVAPTWEATVLGAILASGQDAVASHMTAACLWNLVDRNRPVSIPGIHLSAAHRFRAAGVVAHIRQLPPDERARRLRVPVTSAGRTLLDIAGDPTMTRSEVGLALDDGLRRGVVRLRDVRALVLRHGGRGGPDVRLLRDALGDRQGDYRPGASAWEKEMDEWWDAAGLPVAVRQFRITIGGRCYFLDRAIVDLKISAEWNGFATHGTRSGFEHDAAKARDLVSVGWINIPVTTRTPPEEVCRAVLGAVAQRRAHPPADGRPA